MTTNTPSVETISSIRSQFPGLDRSVYGRPLTYLDNTATSQTPRRVVEAIDRMYYNHKANVHRGVHTLSQEMTALQEASRERVRAFIGATSTEEIIFTRGTTEGINLVASSLGQSFPDGAEVIVSVMEHHSNIVPWQLLSRDGRRITLRVIPADNNGVLDMDAYRSLFNERTAMVSVAHVSNVLGTVNPVKEITEEAHRHGVPVLIDGAQAVSHRRVDVADIGCDFYVFSGHKMYGPTGVGVLYGKKALLEKMPPYQGGGEMIAHVTFDHTTYADLPYKFEAGTPDFTGIAAMNEAINFMEHTGFDVIEAQETALLHHTTLRMTDEIPGIRIYGTAPGKDAIISFMVGRAHPYDVGMLLDKLGIAVRTGHHCAQPLMHSLGVEGLVRASFAVYNTIEEADAFVDALRRVASMVQ
ncbi:MAG: cysteine desulfurase [Muribaculum sp.]|nr:cysteine desulfurase [Muribaculum sp.]